MSSRRRAVCLAALAVIVSVASARAQAVVPRIVAEGAYSYESPSPLVGLRAAFASGDADLLRRLAMETVQTLGQSAPLDAQCCDPANHYELVFAARDRAGAIVVVRVLVDRRDPQDPDLPGLAGAARPFYQIFLSEPGVRLSTLITSTTIENPLVTQLGAFTTAVLKGLALPSSLNLTQTSALAPAPPPPGETGVLFVSLQRAALPKARAKLVIRDSLNIIEPVPLTVSRGRQIVERVHANPQTSTCMRRIATRQQAVLMKTAASATCAGTTLNLAPCFEQLKKATADEYSAAVNDVGAACAASESPRTLGLEFQELTTGEPKAVSSETTLLNRPTEYLSFGLATGFIAKNFQDEPRVKMANGIIVEDPLTRTLAMAVVNWHFLGYRAGLPKPSWQERVRAFGGVAFAPYFGPTAGATVGITRNVGVTAGFGWLVVDRLKGTDQTGAAPSDKVTPFKAGLAPVFFAGASFGFP